MFYCESIDKPEDVRGQDERNVKPLLGLRDSVRLGYVIFGPEVHAVVQQEAPGLTEYKDLFDTSAIGKLPVVYHMRLDNTVHPTGVKPDPAKTAAVRLIPPPEDKNGLLS
ncbi:unnamed protein product [Arctogadus glacialis]